ncbi:hypothetical protein ABPG72_017537 [Tetrahymena utriculariae]
MSQSILRNTQSQTNLNYSRKSSQDNFRQQRYQNEIHLHPQTTKNGNAAKGISDAQSQHSYQQQILADRSKNPLNLTKKMVRVINGKIVPVPENNFSNEHLSNYRHNQNNPRAQSHAQLPNLSQSQQNFCSKPCSTKCIPGQHHADNHAHANHHEDVQGMLNNVESIISNKNVQSYDKLPAESEYTGSKYHDQDGKSCQVKSQMESEVESFINMNEIYYKHLRGLCVCYRCTCGKHRCAYAKNSHLKQPFNVTPAQSIYKINYVPKKGLKDIDFDYGMYENMKGNINTIDLKSVNHTDYTKPDQKYYLAHQQFKPEHKYDYKPLQCGRSHYKRDFLEWGCVPYQPIKGYSQRTTIDEMPFHGQTTYKKDYYKMNAPKAEPTLNNYTTTMVKSPIPFLGITTSQEFFKSYKPGDRAVRYKASDELITGAPSFKGQFKSLSQKDFKDYTNICPVEIELKEPAKKENQVEAN